MDNENIPEVITEDLLQGVCKECGNGTLNNNLNPAFKILDGYGAFEDESYIVCRRCGSHHVDVVVL